MQDKIGGKAFVEWGIVWDDPRDEGPQRGEPSQVEDGGRCCGRAKQPGACEHNVNCNAPEREGNNGRADPRKGHAKFEILELSEEPLVPVGESLPGQACFEASLGNGKRPDALALQVWTHGKVVNNGTTPQSGDVVCEERGPVDGGGASPRLGYRLDGLEHVDGLHRKHVRQSTEIVVRGAKKAVS